jgi:hypothetical protein
VKGEVHEITTNTSAELNKQFQEAIKHLMDNMEVDIPYNKELVIYIFQKIIDSNY